MRVTAGVLTARSGDSRLSAHTIQALPSSTDYSTCRLSALPTSMQICSATNMPSVILHGYYTICKRVICETASASERRGRTLQKSDVFFSRKPVSAICSCRGSTVCKRFRSVSTHNQKCSSSVGLTAAIDMSLALAQRRSWPCAVKHANCRQHAPPRQRLFDSSTRRAQEHDSG